MVWQQRGSYETYSCAQRAISERHISSLLCVYVQVAQYYYAICVLKHL